MLLGEAQATIDVANEAVRQMSGSRLEREAQPSSEIVRHIVKAEVHAEVNSLDIKVDAKVDALETKVDALKAEVVSLSGKLDKLINSMLERQAGEGRGGVNRTFKRRVRRRAVA